MGNKVKFSAIILFCTLLVQSAPLDGCTAFCLNKNGQLVLAKNLDWPIADGFIVVNKRNMKKVAYTKRALKVTWVSKYGSLTFNQFGKEFPLGGMNEAGLVIEELNLYGTGPLDDSLYAVNEFQWVQYHLDNFASVEEIVQNSPFVVVEPILARLHYLIADKSGNIAIIEFYDGQVQIYHGNEVVYPVLSNNRYKNSLRYVKNFMGFGGDLPIRREASSSERFVRTAALVQEVSRSNNVDVISTAFAMLDSVQQHDTQWSIVYDLTNNRIFFRTSVCKELKSVHLQAFNFTCSIVSRYYNILSPDIGCIDSGFQEWSPQINTHHVLQVFQKYTQLDLGDQKEGLFRSLAEYGNAINCQSSQLQE